MSDTVMLSVKTVRGFVSVIRTAHGSLWLNVMECGRWVAHQWISPSEFRQIKEAVA